MGFLYYFFLTLFMTSCLFLCIIILMQESKSMGLGASFGAGDAGSSVFGTSTADVVKKTTSWLAVIFMVGCVVLSLWTTALGRHQAKVADILTEQTVES
ncbi:MAG: preprotein translocase subunit SecG [Parachlamydiales bacterium]|nr:preprotein translocase subunit SecG [Parachlamydiales bacterium]